LTPGAAGNCNGAPELFLRRSLLLSAESIGWEPSLSRFWALGMLPVEVAADEGKPGRFLLGGLAVET
jgi:hypothetical protein